MTSTVTKNNIIIKFYCQLGYSQMEKYLNDTAGIYIEENIQRATEIREVH
jgi:hypothetical protein